MTQPRLPACTGRALGFGRQFCSWVLLLDLGEYLAELFFEPGVQHSVGRRDDALGTQVAGGWVKEGEQFGGASPLVLMRLQDGVAFRLPGCTRLRHRLIRACFICHSRCTIPAA